MAVPGAATTQAQHRLGTRLACALLGQGTRMETPEETRWAAFEREELERCRQAGMLTAAVGILGVAGFAVYDLVFFPELARGFLLMRGVMIALGVVALAVLARPAAARHARWIAWTAGMGVGLMTVVMSVQTGGRASPYYGGVNIVLLALTLLLPWPPAWSAAASTTLLVSYVVAMVAGGTTATTAMLVHNACFLGTTGLIALASTYFQRRGRWREYCSRVAAGEALAHKQTFVASMSHELRTPLHVVINYAGILLDETLPADQHEARRLVERIRERGTFLHGLISDLLDYSKLDAEQMPVRLGPTDVGRVLGELEASFAPVAARRGIALRRVVEGALPVIVTDAQRLEQILTNLVGNALKFTTQGEIVIDAAVRTSDDTLDADGYRRLGARPDRGAGPMLVVTVTDTGVGIRDAHLALLAEDFRQLHDPAADPAGGTGLGLSISRKLATLLGGGLFVRSRHGSGSTFALALPLDARELRAAA